MVKKQVAGCVETYDSPPHLLSLYRYAIFREHAEHGQPPMRPLFYEFPKEDKYFDTQDVSEWLSNGGGGECEFIPVKHQRSCKFDSGF